MFIDSSESSYARTRAIVDCSALKINIDRIQELSGSAGIIAVVKDNAYGHGVEVVCNVLDRHVAGFAVATLAEATHLRRSISEKPIWVFGGFKDKSELACIQEMKLVPIVHSSFQIDLLVAGGRQTQVVLELDSGMGRLGFTPASFQQAYQAILGSCDIVGVMSHFSSAEDPESETTGKQFQCFLSSAPSSGPPRSIANSAAVLGKPDWRLELVRPGLLLYGISPLTDKCGKDHDLVPAMTLESELISVRFMSRGDRIGYGGTWTCPENMRVGVVGCGYGDGYPRSVPAGTPVELNGQRVPVIGRISMDSMVVDLRSAPKANVGDKVILWGPGLPLELIAKHAGTIPNELLVSVTSRVPRVFKE